MKRSLLIFVFFVFIANNLFSQNNSIPVFIEENSQWADSVLETLSAQQRIAQLFMVSAYSNKSEDHKKKISKLIKKYKIGGLMFLQGGPQRQAKLTNYYQSISKTPLMIAIDAEWGIAMRLDSALRFPWQMTLGASMDTNLIYEMGVEIARQCKLIGVNINFAPVVDVNSNPKNPIINNRSFGENAKRVSSLSLAYMYGLQDNNILACAKHFPGHGDTDKDSHKTLPTISHSKQRINKVELVPFKNLINNGLGSVMTAHLFIPSLDSSDNTPISLSRKVVTGLLTKEMGFKGLKFTDGLNMKGATNYATSAEINLSAIQAGNDLLLIPQNVPASIRIIKQALALKTLSEERINKSVRKILKAKYWMGLNNYKPIEISGLQEDLNTIEDELLHRKLLKNAITLIKDSDQNIPLGNLEYKKIAYVKLGDDSGDHFVNMLKNYTKVEVISDNNLDGLLTKLKSYNQVIIGFHKSNKHPWKGYRFKNKELVWLQEIARNKKVIIELKNGKQFVGDLKAFDIHINIVLENAEERIDNEVKRKLGQVFIRGDTITIISTE